MDNILNEKLSQYKRKEKRMKDMDIRGEELRNRLQLRPFHQGSLREYIDILYEQKDYKNAMLYIERVLKLPEIPSSYYHIIRGRCQYRSWYESKNRQRHGHGHTSIEYITLAINSYLTAFEDPIIQRNKSPVYYFELMSMYLRIGEYNSAMDVLSTIVTMYREDIDDGDDETINQSSNNITSNNDSTTIMYIVQYNIAQLLLIAGNVPDAYEEYQQLSLAPPKVTFNPGFDNVCYITTKLFSLLNNIEIARVLQMQGKYRLADSVYYEIWQKMEKYNIGKFSLDISSLTACEESKIDLQFGHVVFKEWYSSHLTYKKLGDIFLKLYNFIMAAEMYGRAAELISKDGWEEMSLADKELASSYILQRGELLAEVGAYEQAEFCAHCVFKEFPHDLVMVGRASRCCREDLNSNSDIVQAGRAILHAVKIINMFLERYLEKRQKLKSIRINKSATMVISLFRMGFVKSKTAAFRLANVSVKQILPLARSLRYAWKRGRENLRDWMELWFISALKIQSMMKHWFSRSKFNKFLRGIRSLKRIYQGQRERVRLRGIIQFIQSQLSLEELSNVEKQFLEDEIRSQGIWMPLNNISRISSGAITLTDQEILQENIYSNALAFKNRKYRSNPNTNQNTKLIKYLNDEDIVQSVDNIDNSFEMKKNNNSRDFGVSWFSCLDPEKSLENSVGKKFQNQAALKSLVREMNGYELTEKELHAYIQQIYATNSDEDVVSLISTKSVTYESAIQWVPFGILPESEITRLLSCTVLVICSPSFSMNDCKRLNKVICFEDNRNRLWWNIRSVIIYGTNIGSSGLFGLLDIGVSHLKSLSISHVGSTYQLGQLLGRQMLSRMNGVALTCNIQKLYIEGETRFGNRGMCSLLQFLQSNESLLLLTVRHCQLSHRSAMALMRYIPIVMNLEILILNDNCFTCEDIKVILRSLANKGTRGRLKSISLKDQVPALTLKEALTLYNLGLDLSIRVIADIIPCRLETLEELKRNSDLDTDIIRSMEYVINRMSITQPQTAAEDIRNSGFLRTIYI